MYWLFATEFDQVRNRPRIHFDLCCHRWRHLDRAVDFAEIVIREIQTDCPIIVRRFAECVYQARQAAAVYPQRKALAFDV